MTHATIFAVYLGVNWACLVSEAAFPVVFWFGHLDVTSWLCVVIIPTPNAGNLGHLWCLTCSLKPNPHSLLLYQTLACAEQVRRACPLPPGWAPDCHVASETCPDFSTWNELSFFFGPVYTLWHFIFLIMCCGCMSRVLSPREIVNCFCQSPI